MGADAGDQRLQPRRVVGDARRRLGDFALEDSQRAAPAARRRRVRAPETTAQPFSHSAAVSASNTPAPAAGSATKPRCDSSSRMSCALRASRRAKRVGQAERLGVRQHADAVGAAEAGRERGDRAAHHVHVRVARAHRPPRALGMDARRRGVEAAGRAHAAPHQAQGAKLGEGEELVGVGGEAEADRRRRRFARKPPSASARR